MKVRQHLQLKEIPSCSGVADFQLFSDSSLLLYSQGCQTPPHLVAPVTCVLVLTSISVLFCVDLLDFFFSSEGKSFKMTGCVRSVGCSFLGKCEGWRPASPTGFTCGQGEGSGATFFSSVALNAIIG